MLVPTLCLFLSAALAADAGSKTPHLDHIEAGLRSLAPKAEGTLWKRTEGNAIQNRNNSWLLQTPDCFGNVDPNKNCAQHNAPGALALAATIQADIASATSWVDIATLATFNPKAIATGIFHQAIVQGIKLARAKHPNITIRILGGTPPTRDLGMAAKYLALLLKDLGSAADGARILVAGVESSEAYSWNHAKIVAVDGVSAIVGGNNLWEEAYNSNHPINDVSMRLEGPAAESAHSMADLLWQFTCANVHTINVELVRSSGIGASECPSTFSGASSNVRGTTSVLAMGELGFGMHSLDGVSGAPAPANDAQACCSTSHTDYLNNDAQYSVDNPELEGLRLLAESAQSSLFIAQQDVLFPCMNLLSSAFVNSHYDARFFNIIADKLLAAVPVTMVLSTPKDDGNSDGYSIMHNLQEVSDVVLRKVKERGHLDDKAAQAIVCKHFKLASVRIGDNMPKWADGFAIGQHAKIIAVDDAAFYLGSKNLYPTQLQDFGFVVEEPNAAAALKRDFLDKLWHYSQQAASINVDAGVCKLSRQSMGELYL